MFDELAKTFFDSNKNYKAGLDLLRQYRIADQQYRNFSDVEENFLFNLDDHQSGLLEMAIALLQKRATLPHDGVRPETNLSEEEFKRIAESLHKHSSSSSHNLHSKRLSEAFKDFIEEKRHDWKNTNGSEDQYVAEAFPLFQEINGDLETASLRKEHVTRYAKAVLSLPKNRRKMPEYRDLPISALMNLSIPKDKQLSNTTKRNYLGRMSTFLHWLEDHDYSQKNLFVPLKTASPKKTTRANRERDQFSDSDLTKLFNSNDYIKGQHKYPFQYWVPLIGLFTGARENEICQLFLTDIYKDADTGIWVFDINENEPSKTKKSLKRAFHKRQFPIHKALIDLGFLEFVELMRSRGETRLFPELPHKGKNKYADKAQRWFNNTYKKKCRLTGNTSFHSLRHTFINHMKKQLRLDTNSFVEMIGQSTSGNESDQRYIKPLTLKDFYKHYRKLHFDSIDLKTIKRWNPRMFSRTRLKSI